MSTDSVAEAWEEVSDNPDLARDLGYLLLELEVIASNTGQDQVIILPKDESLLKEDAFIVSASDDIVELERHR